MLVTSVFSFSHSVFYLSLCKYQLSFTFILAPANSFNRYKILSFGKDLTNGKIFARTSLKAQAEIKLNVAKMMNSVFDRVENIVGKEESTGYRHYSLFQQCFSLGTLKVRIVWQVVGSSLYLTHYHTIPHFDALKINSCGKHCEKRRNCL